MPNETSENQFSLESYLSNLMEQMNMLNAPEAVQKEALWQLGRQAAYQIMVALSLQLTDANRVEMLEWDEIEDLAGFVERAMKISPQAEEAVLKALENFYNETLEAFNEFKNNQSV